MQKQTKCQRAAPPLLLTDKQEEDHADWLNVKQLPVYEGETGIQKYGIKEESVRKEGHRVWSSC